MQLEQTEQAVNDFVANILANGSDDQLFASGYLQGHLDLILQGCIQEQQDFTNFMAQMEQSLTLAYSNNELAQPDRLLVQDCWLQLKAKFS
ncbi:MAG: YfcL family protein [Gammaproteobacteria bacterium]|nr:YfcL family protein [Gammaproteobacteria bacterium]